MNFAPLPHQVDASSHNNITKHLQLLGMRVEDVVTGFRGVVANVGFDLYGCIQAVVNPGVDADGSLRDSQWFDVNRLRVVSETPVLKPPSFQWTEQVIAEGRKGAGEKPPYCKP